MVKQKQAEVKQAEDMTSEELGLMLNQNYTDLIRVKENIQTINQTLTKRKEEHVKPDESDA